MKNKLQNKEIEFKVKTGNNGKVFGSITSKNISEELEKMGYQIEKNKVIISNDINTLGIHSVTIVLHKEVSFNINVKLSSL
ncbi:MAG: 50S ribosomal protein L9 [Clostridium sp.]|nr:MAG: 50S ribosomal protein L9 [Clostridium sp.]